MLSGAAARLAARLRSFMRTCVSSSRSGLGLNGGGGPGGALLPTLGPGGCSSTGGRRRGGAFLAAAAAFCAALTVCSIFHRSSAVLELMPTLSRLILALTSCHPLRIFSGDAARKLSKGLVVVGEGGEGGERLAVVGLVGGAREACWDEMYAFESLSNAGAGMHIVAFL